MRALVILKLLTLLTVANGAPLLAKNILRDRFSYPVDGGLCFIDRHPLFGQSKTIRGVVASIVLTAACAPAFGLEWKLGALVGVTAMMGDLFSSFLKRRFALPSAGQAIGLDQVPESLLPLLICRRTLQPTLPEIVVIVAAFFIGGIFLSRLLYKWRLRDRPY